MDNNTPPPANEPPASALAQQAAGGNEPPSSNEPPPPVVPSGEQRPEWLPEKFFKDGKPQYDQLAISYQNLEKAFNSKKSAPTRPGDDATPEQKAAYWADLRKITGAPEKVEDYGLKAPENLPEGVEWNAELATKAASIAHKYGVPPEALNELVALNNENMAGIVSKSAEAQKAQVEAMVNGLNAEWGADAKTNWQRANRGAIALGIDTTKSELANNPEFIKAMLRVDQMLREDAGLIHGDDERQTYEEQMKKIQTGDDFLGKNGPEKQMEALNRLKRLHDAAKS